MDPDPQERSALSFPVLSLQAPQTRGLGQTPSIQHYAFLWAIPDGGVTEAK